MTVSTYLCRVLGEQPQRVQRLHDTTQRRMKAHGLAIHLPVALWAITGYLIAARVFNLDSATAAGVSAFCALLIYLVERLVLATPKSWVVNTGRLVIGTVIAILGASAVDLVVFEREVTLQLRAAGEARITAEFDAALAEQRRTVAQRKADWMKAQEAANCEANGTCGSRVRSLGPIHRELTRQATALRQDYDAAQARLEAIDRERTAALSRWRNSPQALEEAGLLSRVKALHDYTMGDPMALTAWSLFFLLVLSLELTVVFAKLVFGETVDDELDRIREEVSRHKASSYLEAVRSPMADARRLLETAA